MKRIVLVVPVFPRGSETFIVSKFLGLLARGWDVHVVCQQNTAKDWRRFPELQRTPEVKKRVHVTLPSRPRWRALFLLPLAVLAGLVTTPGGTLRYLRHGWHRFGLGVLRHFYLDAPIIRLQPDLIHWEFGALAVGRMHLREMVCCKILVSFRGYDINFAGLENPDYYKEIWSHADAVHVLGEDLWQRALKRGCRPDTLHALIPPAIDLKKFDPQGREFSRETGSKKHPFLILSVGRLEWKKGYEYALQAVKLLMEQGIHCEYRIIGGGGFLEVAAFACHQLGLNDAVQFLGALPPDEVKKHLLWAEVFLHAAVTEGFCNAVLEAQAMMLPVVCTDAGGLPENVADGETGFVVPRRNPEEMANRLMLLAQDHKLRHKLGLAGRQRVMDRFGLPQQIAAFEKLYQQILKDGSHERPG